MEKQRGAIITTILCILSLLTLTFINGQGCAQQPECRTNTDCTRVQLTCCPCNMGGQEGCVPRALAPIYEDKLKDCPPQEQLICTALYNCKVEECVCLKGNCEDV